MNSSRVQIYEFNETLELLSSMKGCMIKWRWVPDSFDYLESCIFITMNHYLETKVCEENFDFIRFVFNNQQTYNSLSFFKSEFKNGEHMQIEILK